MHRQATEGDAVSRGLLFVVSAPSGTGKTTLVERLVEVIPNLVISRSYTSRAVRPGERTGVDYNFISRQQFESMIAQAAFLEWADVFGHLYGTATADTEQQLGEGRDVVLVIDVQGARQVRRRGIDAVTVFVLPPSLAILEARLKGRSKDSEAQMQQRLEVARREVTAFDEYQYLVVNDELESCVDRLRAVVLAARAQLPGARPQAEAIIDTFGADARDAGGR